MFFFLQQNKKSGVRIRTPVCEKKTGHGVGYFMTYELFLQHHIYELCLHILYFFVNLYIFVGVKKKLDEMDKYRHQHVFIWSRETPRPHLV